MAKVIRKFGVMFFVIVILCLLFAGALYTNISNKTSFDANENLVINSGDEKAVNYTPDYTLDGTNEEMAATWSQAIQASINEKSVKTVLLNNDWIAPATGNHLFGTGVGFWAGSGSLTIHKNANIIFDLNGHTIDKQHTSKVAYGSCFTVLNGGKLTINDSSYSKETLFQTYEDNKNKSATELMQVLRELPFGRLTGGACNDTGGAIYSQAGSELSFNGGMIIDNIYAPCGGAIYSDSKLIINGGLFMNNYATKTSASAGGIKCGTEVVINNAIFVGNHANSNGGAIYSDNATLFSIDNCIMSHNSADNFGGAIFISRGKLNRTITNTTFSHNESKSNGGGVYIEQNTIVDLTNCILDNNKTSICGGGVYVVGNVNLKSCTISENIASLSGGGVFISIDSTSTISGCEVIKNSCVDYGGGIYCHNQSVCTINDSNIAENTANYGGGMAFNNIVKLTNTSVVNNIGLSSHAGVLLGDSNARLIVSGATIIKDNKLNGKDSNINLVNGKKIEIDGVLTKDSKKAYISILLNEDYNIFEPFTLGYSYHGNGNISPSTYFNCENENKIAKMKKEEVVFDFVNDSVYDFIYLENNERKNYKDNEKLHGYNDSDIEKYILGNIAPNTSVKEFIETLGFDTSKIVLKDNKGKDRYKNNAPVDSATYDNKYELAVGTGWRVEYTNNGNTETIYLSVLGDVTGDGRISAVDVTYLRQVANDKEAYDNLSVEKKLASLVLNVGLVTTADAEIIRNIMDNKLDIKLFF